MVQNTVKINKHMKQSILVHYYGPLKELFVFNKLEKLIYVIIFRIILFYKEILSINCDINIPGF